MKKIYMTFMIYSMILFLPGSTGFSSSFSQNSNDDVKYTLHFGYVSHDGTVPKTDVLMKLDDRKIFLTFCKAPHGDSSKKISRVYFNGGWHGFEKISQDDKELRSLIKECHNAGIEIYNTQGYHGWADEGGKGSADAIIENLIRFNKQGKLDERFDGLLLDVEPYVLGNSENDKLKWKTDYEKIWTNYLSVLDLIRSKIEHYRKDAGQDFPLGEAIPFWYSKEADNGLGSYRDVIDRMDFTWIMAYRDKGQDIVNAVKDEIDYANKMGKPTAIGFPVYGFILNYQPQDRETFMEEGIAALDTAIIKNKSIFQSANSFKEVSFFIYEFYKDLVP